jgi:histidinol-phosphate aminotransferase
MEKSAAHNVEYRKILTARLQQAGIKTWPSEGNFVLADYGDPERASAANAFFHSRGIIVRAVRGYGLPNCLRITIGTAEEVELIAEAMDSFMATQDWTTHA